MCYYEALSQNFSPLGYKIVLVVLMCYIMWFSNVQQCTELLTKIRCRPSSPRVRPQGQLVSRQFEQVVGVKTLLQSIHEVCDCFAGL
jgi:hypothetical protein